MPNLAKAREQLLTMRDEYSQRIKALDKDLSHEDEPVEKDFAEQATQMENQQVLEALDDEARLLVSRINAALQRIENGSYGICEYCGEVISSSRLNAVPYTTLCITCAEKIE